MNCFLCWVDYALEENVLTFLSKYEFWPLIKYNLILRGRDTHIDFLWSAWFPFWYKSIFFLGPFKIVKLFIAAD